VIRAGTLVFGDNPFGVRVLGVILSLPASWFVWRTAALILKDDKGVIAFVAAFAVLRHSPQRLPANPGSNSTLLARAEPVRRIPCEAR